MLLLLLLLLLLLRSGEGARLALAMGAPTFHATAGIPMECRQQVVWPRKAHRHTRVHTHMVQSEQGNCKEATAAVHVPVHQCATGCADLQESEGCLKGGVLEREPSSHAWWMLGT